MYQNLQYPYSPTAVNLTTPYSGQNGFQTAVPMPSAQITNPNVIFGKRVGRASDITPNDVPMDGTIGYFPTNENTIISKKWNSTRRLILCATCNQH